MSAPLKSQIIALLDAFIRQRPGLEAGNYFCGGDYRANLANYRAEVRSIGRDLAHAQTLLRQVELSGITGEELAAAFPRAYSGRLTLAAHATVPGAWTLDYCTGQYWPTEYRRAVCAVLAGALWAYKREHCMPAPAFHVGDGATFATMGEASAYVEEHNPTILAIEERFKGMRAGDWLRTSFRREFGRGIANRWFD